MLTKVICCQCGRTYYTGGDMTYPSGMNPGHPCGHGACEDCVTERSQ